MQGIVEADINVTDRDVEPENGTKPTATSNASALAVVDAQVAGILRALLHCDWQQAYVAVIPHADALNFKINWHPCLTAQMSLRCIENLDHRPAQVPCIAAGIDRA